MQRWIRRLLVPLLSLVMSAQAMAALVPIQPTLPPILTPVIQIKTVPVSFGAVPNRYTNVDPSTTFDLNGDLVGDIQVSDSTVTGKNGTTLQLLDPAVLNLDQVQAVPGLGYSASAAVQLSRVYVAQLPSGQYAKFMLLQASPKVTIWFLSGSPTSSVLQADGTGGHATLTWDPLPDATLGYNIYRYEFLDDNAYTVTQLNDFTVQETSYVDDTARNRYYLYVVMAVKAGGSFGSTTTVAPVQVQSLQRRLVIDVTAGTAKVDGAAVAVAVKPVIKNGRLTIPASLLTNVGVQVSFDAATSRLTLIRRLDNVTYTVVMTVDVPDYTWNGTAYRADVPPYKSGSEVMIPLRVVAPALGFGLSFNSDDRTATVQWYE